MPFNKDVRHQQKTAPTFREILRAAKVLEHAGQVSLQTEDNQSDLNEMNWSSFFNTQNRVLPQEVHDHEIISGFQVER